MFLKLKHTELTVFQENAGFSAELLVQLQKKFPNEEKFNMVSQIRRAALSVHLNIAEGSSRKSVMRAKAIF